MAEALDEATRFAVLDRDDYQCQVCGRRGEEHQRIHHVVYRSQGGGHDLTNLVTVCWKCHAEIHDGTLVVTYLEWKPGQWSCFWERL